MNLPSLALRYFRPLASLVVFAATSAGAAAQAPPTPPPVEVPQPPAVPTPAVPGAFPTRPATPAVPPTAGTPMPGTPGANPPAPPTAGRTPAPAMSPVNAPSPLARELTSGISRSSSAPTSRAVYVFGDLFGGGGIAGPFPVLVGKNGQFLSQPPVILDRNGRRQVIGSVQGTPVDESLLGRPNPTPEQLAGATVMGYLPPPGTVLAPELASQVSRIPQITRGAFKVTENESVRPTTRAYFNYYFYDQLFRNFGGSLTPRITLHQEIFGYEQAFGDGRYSIGLRLPFNQLVSPGFVNKTGIGDLTIVTKMILMENQETGNVLSGGLIVTTPTGDTLFPSTLTGQVVHPTLLQPYLGYLVNRGDFFVQGFSSIIVPTDSSDVTFIANDIALGYYAYRSEASWLAAVVPVFEAHINTPLNHRGAQVDPVGFVDQVTLLGGSRVVLRNGLSFGCAVGAPITGPRPFSLQTTLQLNYEF